MRTPLELWSPVEVRHTYDATPEQVFAVLREPRTYPEWLVGAQRIRSVDADFPAPGSEFHHSVGPAQEATVDDSSQALAVDPPHRLVLRVRVGPLDGTVEMLVERVAAGTEVRFREAPAGWARVVLPVLRPALHGRNAESLRRLADVVAGAGS